MGVKNMKEVTRVKDGIETKEMTECHPLKLEPALKYVDPIWFEAIRMVFSYEKERNAGLQEIHKLFTDSRIKDGLDLVQNKKVVDIAITSVDVRAKVKGNEGEYTVTMKNWKPEKLLRYRYEMERYISELFIDCSCQDHVIQHYRSNSAIACKHICAVLWMLQNNYSMPKFFVTEKEQKYGYQKSGNNIDLATNLLGVPLKKYSYYMNIFAMKDFKGFPSSLAYSIHKELNPEYQTKMPTTFQPEWIHFNDYETIKKITQATIKGYLEMLSKFPEKNIEQEINSILPFKDKMQKIEQENEELKQKVVILEKWKARKQKTSRLTTKDKRIIKSKKELLKKINKMIKGLV